MNASKALGKEVELPDSLKKIAKWSKISEEDRQSDKSGRSSPSSGSKAVSQEKIEAMKEQTEPKHSVAASEPKSFSKSLSLEQAYKSRVQ